MNYTRAELIKLNESLEEHNNNLLDLNAIMTTLDAAQKQQIENYKELNAMKDELIAELRK